MREGACIGGATMLQPWADIEVDPQRCGLGSCQSDFALQAVVDVLKNESLRFPGEPQKHIMNSTVFPLYPHVPPSGILRGTPY